MNSNLDIWAVQTNPSELTVALSQIKDGLNIIYNNCISNISIGSHSIKTRQFDTILYNEKSDVLIMLMRGCKATKDDMMMILDSMDKRYIEVTFAPPIDEYEDTFRLPDIWFACDVDVVYDALSDTKDKGITTCEYYPLVLGSMDLSYLANTHKKYNIDGRRFKGVLVDESKIVLLINREDNVNDFLESNNINEDDIQDLTTKFGLQCYINYDEEITLFSDTLKKMR